MINLAQLDNKKMLLIILAGLIIAYLDFTFIMGMQQSAASRSAQQAQKLKQEIDNFEREFNNMRQIKDKKDKAVEAELLRAKKLLTEEELPDLIQKISGLANENNVKIMQITPVKETKPAKEEKPGSAVEAQYKAPQPLLINMELVCDYHSLGAFIDDLEGAKEFMAIDEINITQDAANYALQKAALKVKTYVKK
jgi:Tfp pilus assembly protein PilO